MEPEGAGSVGWDARVDRTCLRCHGQAGEFLAAVVRDGAAAAGSGAHCGAGGTHVAPAGRPPVAPSQGAITTTAPITSTGVVTSTGAVTTTTAITRTPVVTGTETLPRITAPLTGAELAAGTPGLLEGVATRGQRCASMMATSCWLRSWRGPMACGG